MIGCTIRRPKAKVKEIREMDRTEQATVRGHAAEGFACAGTRRAAKKRDRRLKRGLIYSIDY